MELKDVRRLLYKDVDEQIGLFAVINSAADDIEIPKHLDHPNVIKASVNTPVHEVAEKMLKNNISHIPVVNSDDRLIGMVTDIDLMACMF